MSAGSLPKLFGINAFEHPGSGPPMSFRGPAHVQRADLAGHLGLPQLVVEIGIPQRFAANGDRVAADVAGRGGQAATGGNE